MLLALAFVIYTNCATFPADIDIENLKSAQKNGYSLLGALLGFCVAYPLERKYIRFAEKASWWVQILKVLGGFVGVIAVKEGLKILFSALNFTWLGSNAIRYFVMVFFAAAIWPLVFKPLSKLGRKSQCLEK